VVGLLRRYEYKEKTMNYELIKCATRFGLAG
jgi:hypothetical protein